MLIGSFVGTTLVPSASLASRLFVYCRRCIILHMRSFPRFGKSTLSHFSWKTVKVSLGSDLADLVFFQGISFLAV
jgi:hypothetical protein